MTNEELTKDLAKIASAHDLYLEEVRYIPAGRNSVLRVIVDLPDGPGGVASETLTEVTRALSAHLDDSPNAPKGSYTLEVSTPGATRELTEPRHFRRAEGRMIIVETADEKIRGRLTGVEPDRLCVSTTSGDVDIATDAIRRAHMDVEL
ncbi:MAG: DUF2642 domain-containing protein [Flaviflexus sp.]|nr:DUF2642 domain-containing protein [Flaviflexus sp.]